MTDRPDPPAHRTLGDVFAQVRLADATWCYADMAGASGFNVAPGPEVAIHAMIHGTLRLACTGGAAAQIGPGDVVAVLTGEAHAMRTVAGAQTTPHAGLRPDRREDIPPTLAFGDDSRIGARVLSARLPVGWPDGVERGALPPLLHLTGPQTTSLLRPDAMALAGMGAGSCALLTRLAEAMLIARMRVDPACRAALLADRRDPIEEARQLIVANPASAWTVESLARAVGMGRSNFAAQFAAAVGKAPMEMVAQQRMEHAAMLLRQGRMKIIEVAELSGYGSEAAFSRRFARHFGVSPSTMRDRARIERDAAREQQGFRPLLAGEPGRLRSAGPLPVATTGASAATGPADRRFSFFARGRRS